MNEDVRENRQTERWIYNIYTLLFRCNQKLYSYSQFFDTTKIPAYLRAAYMLYSYIFKYNMKKKISYTDKIHPGHSRPDEENERNKKN